MEMQPLDTTLMQTVISSGPSSYRQCLQVLPVTTIAGFEEENRTKWLNTNWQHKCRQCVFCAFLSSSYFKAKL